MTNEGPMYKCGYCDVYWRGSHECTVKPGETKATAIFRDICRIGETEEDRLRKSNIALSADLLATRRALKRARWGVRELYWHCLQCGDHEPVEPTGDTSGYTLGDHEKCIRCGDGTAHVVTMRMGAAFEQGIALGMSTTEAWERAKALEATDDE